MKLSLTPHACIEGINVIDTIFAEVGVVKRSDRINESALAAELRRQWRKKYSAALRDLLRAIPEEIVDDAVQIIEDGLLDALGEAFGASDDVRRLMRSYIEDAYKEGKGRWSMPTPGRRNSSLLSMPDRRAIEVLTEHNCFWLGEHYGKQIGPKVSAIARQALTDGIGRKELARQLEAALGGVAPKDYKYWDVAASAALVRGRSFGMVSGMVEAQIVEYEILTMNDERRCGICGAMDGRVFRVSDAQAKIDEVLNITDPQAFKDALPWQKKPSTGVSSSTLAAEGQSLPPFHGRCRCIVIGRTSSVQIGEEEPGERDRKVVEGINRGVRTEKDAVALGELLYDRMLGVVENMGETDSLADLMAVEVGKYRELGGTPSFVPRSNKAAKAFIQQAAKWFPSDWMEEINANGGILAKSARRGFFRLTGNVHEIAVSGKGTKTALHELGHALEKHFRSMDIEKEFYDRRTAGFPLERLKDITNLRYSKDEVARKDDFADPYMGKDYKGRAYEVFSMGLEGVYFNEGDMWHKDPETIKFIIGILLGVGR